jgi:hypothetical protein
VIAVVVSLDSNRCEKQFDVNLIFIIFAHRPDECELIFLTTVLSISF